MAIVRIWELICQLSDSPVFAMLDFTNSILDLTGVSAHGLSWEISRVVGALCSVRIKIVLSCLGLVRALSKAVESFCIVRSVFRILNFAELGLTRRFLM